jgi:hypothetical protein
LNLSSKVGAARDTTQTQRFEDPEPWTSGWYHCEYLLDQNDSMIWKPGSQTLDHNKYELIIFHNNFSVPDAKAKQKNHSDRNKHDCILLFAKNQDASSQIK